MGALIILLITTFGALIFLPLAWWAVATIMALITAMIGVAFGISSNKDDSQSPKESEKINQSEHPQFQKQNPSWLNMGIFILLLILVFRSFR